MESLKRLSAAPCIGFLLLLLSSCERPLYFGTHQSHQITRLENPGDFQIQLSGQMDMGLHQIYQADAEVAISRLFALRASMVSGGEYLLADSDKSGTVQARQFGFGSYYAFPVAGYRGASWIGYASGSATNTNTSYSSALFSPITSIETFNRFERFFAEQQVRYTIKTVDFFGSLTFGASRVLDLQITSTVPEQSDYGLQLQRQQNMPMAAFGVLGFGISGGSPNLRAHLRFDQWFGRAAYQVGNIPSTFVSTGFSWRLQPLK